MRRNSCYKIDPTHIPADGTRLNLGSGIDLREGFINLDQWEIDNVGQHGYIQWDLEADRIDLGNGHNSILPFYNGTFDYILARDVLEHIPHRVKDLQGEFFVHLVNDIIRVSKPMAILEIMSPCRPDCLGASEHCRMITRETFRPWRRSRLTSKSLDVWALAKGSLVTVVNDNHRQWDPRDWTRLGRAVAKHLVFKVIPDYSWGEDD